MTLSVTFMDVVVGKFLAGVVFIMAMLPPTFAYSVTVAILGNLGSIERPIYFAHDQNPLY